MSEERYLHGDVECIDAIRAALTPEEFRGFCKGNVLKYVWRERYKGGDGDLGKALDYIMWATGEADAGGLESVSHRYDCNTESDEKESFGSIKAYLEEYVAIGAYLGEYRPKRVCVEQVAREALGLTREDILTNGHASHAYKNVQGLLDNMPGWHRVGKQRTTGYGTVLCWEPVIDAKVNR